MQKTDLNRLRDFFPAEDLEWKPITVSKRTSKGLAAAYITNRAIMERLDEIVGPENWKNEFRPGPNGGVVCGLSIWIESRNEWVTKWDGADNTDIEAIKGGLSNAMRRAAVHWGIGRYLYDLPSQWVPVDDHGRFSQAPRIPREFLPDNSRPEPRAEARPAPAERRAPSASGDGANAPVRPAPRPHPYAPKSE